MTWTAELRRPIANVPYGSCGRTRTIAPGTYTVREYGSGYRFKGPGDGKAVFDRTRKQVDKLIEAGALLIDGWPP